ncbi:hypothetical protein [Haloechinothrix salitolerans]|uniref:Uncharacterized protein n=1 Tax=Haloechinothrix salitolerans TaxID=926830 RepID=A0ABW2BTQ2_9PSEU
MFRTFIIGGVLGASVLETYLLHPSACLYGGVGLIEEAVKLVALTLLTQHLAVDARRADPRRPGRDGLWTAVLSGFLIAWSARCRSDTGRIGARICSS